ncbi:uncharacterized protein TNCV_1941331 [Trichonephila clavipes]|uniref:CCHC-type domain-containing protein n=1 Tax=Trichonephila clavipes TaxID=2585209 RepID=A0A8X6VIV1_TRICX|nr:uncharacterized protein TNCV_1941331 [Trichonephila clavipes]
MVSWDYLWPTLRCRREAGGSPLLSIGWWYLSSVSPKRQRCRVSAADKGCRVYPLDPHPDAVALYSGCTSVQTKSFLLTKSFLGSPANITPHKSLNSSRDVISEPDLLTTSEAEILEGFSNQGVIQPKLALVPLNPTLTHSPVHTFGHSQTACRGQLTCSRCASVGHASTDCSLEPKCINCSQPHTADSKLLVQTYAKAAKPSIVNNSTQTDENITKIKCPPLNLLQPLSSLPKQNKLISTPVISTSSSSTQAELLPSTSSKAATVLQPTYSYVQCRTF